MLIEESPRHVIEVQVHFKNGSQFSCKKTLDRSALDWLEMMYEDGAYCLEDDSGRCIRFDFDNVLGIVTIPEKEPEESVETTGING